MSIQIPPSGTRGSRMGKMPGPVAAVIHVLYGWFGARMTIRGQPLLELQTLGSKSGLRRTTILGFFPPTETPVAPPAAPDRGWLVVASNGGSARHPGWFVNLARHPEDVWVRVGKQRLKVLPDSLAGAERDEAWKRVITMSPGYAGYATATDRQIPLVRLRPVN